jgi:hypothetical protein
MRHGMPLLPARGLATWSRQTQRAGPQIACVLPPLCGLPAHGAANGRSQVSGHRLCLGSGHADEANAVAGGAQLRREAVRPCSPTAYGAAWNAREPSDCGCTAQPFLLFFLRRDGTIRPGLPRRQRQGNSYCPRPRHPPSSLPGNDRRPVRRARGGIGKGGSRATVWRTPATKTIRR